MKAMQSPFVHSKIVVEGSFFPTTLQNLSFSKLKPVFEGRRRSYFSHFPCILTMFLLVNAASDFSNGYRIELVQ